MPAPVKTRAAVLVELDELGAAHAAAVERLEALRADEASFARRHAQAKAPLLAYYERIGAGEAEDPDEEARLRADLEAFEASTATTTKVAVNQNHPSAVVVDEALEAKLAGAERAADEAAKAVRTFVRAREDDLCGALVAMAVSAGAGVSAAIDTLMAADAQWEAVRDEWAPILRVLRPGERGLHHSPADVALGSFSPYNERGQLRDGRELFPAPVDLVPVTAVPAGWGTAAPAPPVSAITATTAGEGAGQRLAAATAPPGQPVTLDAIKATTT